MITPILKVISPMKKLTAGKVIGVIVLVIGVIFFNSCEKNITVEVPHAEAEVVVEGYIEAGGHPIVFLSNSLPFFGTISTNQLDQLQSTIQGATITVNNGMVTDTLQQISGYGVYYSLSMTGEAGKTYSLRIITGGKILTASTFIPPPIHLDSVWFKVDGNRDSLGYAWAHLTDPDTLGNCYRWFAQRINQYTYGDLSGHQKDTAFVTPRGSVFDDKFINGRSFDLAFDRGKFPNSTKEDDNNDEEGFFKRGDTIVVKFCTIDRAHFEFWRTEETQVANNGNPFGSPAPVTSNINGGLGIWGGYNATYDTIIAH